jgi:membrane associated rhomboid family serine protease
VTSGQSAFGGSATPAAFVLIALNVAAFLVEIAGGGGGFSGTGSSVVNDFGLRGISVADGEWYRLITGGFLHAGLVHLGFNMFVIFILGRLLEPAIGTPRFVGVYFASLLAGSFGALLLADPLQTTVGASGAVFGLFGAVIVIARFRRLDEIASQLGFWLLINLAITFAVPQISIGGHLGGLAGGLVCSLFIVAGERGMLGERRLPLELAAISAVAFLSAAAAITVA